MFTKAYYDKIDRNNEVDIINKKWGEIFPKAIGINNTKKADSNHKLMKWYKDGWRFWLEGHDPSWKYYARVLNLLINHQDLIIQSAKHNDNFEKLIIELKPSCNDCNKYILCKICENTKYFYKCYFLIHKDDDPCSKCCNDTICNDCIIKNNKYNIYLNRFINIEQNHYNNDAPVPSCVAEFDNNDNNKEQNKKSLFGKYLKLN